MLCRIKSRFLRYLLGDFWGISERPHNLFRIPHQIDKSYANNPDQSYAKNTFNARHRLLATKEAKEELKLLKSRQRVFESEIRLASSLLVGPGMLLLLGSFLVWNPHQALSFLTLNVLMKQSLNFTLTYLPLTLQPLVVLVPFHTLSFPVSHLARSW